MPLPTIASFTVDHDTLTPGVYISRTDGDLVTLDLRLVKPNTPPYLQPAAVHSFEHLFATYARNSRFGDRVVYFGPMGCRTGYYLVVRDLESEYALALVKEAAAFVAEFPTMHMPLPGNRRKECGNYRSHNVKQAAADAARFYEAIKDRTVEDMRY
jgi:S-ribosylhomocysteine lyase